MMAPAAGMTPWNALSIEHSRSSASPRTPSEPASNATREQPCFRLARSPPFCKRASEGTTSRMVVPHRDTRLEFRARESFAKSYRSAMKPSENRTQILIERFVPTWKEREWARTNFSRGDHIPNRLLLDGSRRLANDVRDLIVWSAEESP